MKLSTRARYGARLMLDLAVHDGGEFLLLKDVARREEISEKYLGHLIPALKQAGLIKSSRGAHGGYVLAKQPSEINLGDVVRAVEGNLGLVECVISPDVCHRAGTCVTRRKWALLRTDMLQFLDSITLQQMADERREIARRQPLMWYI